MSDTANFSRATMLEREVVEAREAMVQANFDHFEDLSDETARRAAAAKDRYEDALKAQMQDIIARKRVWFDQREGFHAAPAVQAAQTL